jgi:hypothetical protein
VLVCLIKGCGFESRFSRKLKRAYSSMVERTAHNGLVIGSNPIKLKKNILSSMEEHSPSKR